VTTAAAENELPEEIDALKRIVIEQRARIEALTLLIAKLRRMQFGRSSERVTQEIEQLELALDEPQTEAAISERASAPEGKTNKAPRGVRKRQELLPVESARNLFGRTYLVNSLFAAWAKESSVNGEENESHARGKRRPQHNTRTPRRQRRPTARKEASRGPLRLVTLPNHFR
jgi:hypothetical protein